MVNGSNGDRDMHKLMNELMNESFIIMIVAIVDRNAVFPETLFLTNAQWATRTLFFSFFFYNMFIFQGPTQNVRFFAKKLTELEN